MKRFSVFGLVVGALFVLSACAPSLSEQVDLSLHVDSPRVTLAKIGGKQEVTFSWTLKNRSGESLDSKGYELALLRAEENRSSRVLMKTIDFSVASQSEASGDTVYLYDYTEPAGSFSVVLQLSQRDGGSFIPVRDFSVPFEVIRLK